jgi:hypothetical protein
MPFSVVAAGTSLQLLFTDGSIQTLTLPTGVTVLSGTRLRGAVMNRNVVIVNCTTRPVWLDADGLLYPLSLAPPSHVVFLAAGAAGSLTGTFKVKVAFAVKDAVGNILMETTLGPESAEVSVTNQFIDVTNIPIAGDSAVNCRRVYRTSDGPGTEYFPWFDLDDNSTTTYSSDTSDEALGTLPAPDDLGSAPPRLTNITEWKGRLWAVDPADLDAIRFTADGKHYGWPTTNRLVVRPIGRDPFGVTAFLPRRDELGVAKRNIIWKVAGSNEDDFRMVKLVEGQAGQQISVAPDSANIVLDVARWLGSDGVYEWTAEGVRSITDEDTRPWFTTDTYFNRAQFPNAVARYEPRKHAYELLLAAAGGTTLNRWISYDIDARKWWGPHKTDAFTPTCAGAVLDSNSLLQGALGGSDGYLYVVTPGVYRDLTATAIALDGLLHVLQVPDPDLTHYYGEIFAHTKIQAGGTLTITPYLGGLDAAAQTAISHGLTTGRQRLRRVGVGRLESLQLTNSEVDQEVVVYDLEQPWHVVGRR